MGKADPPNYREEEEDEDDDEECQPRQPGRGTTGGLSIPRSSAPRRALPLAGRDEDDEDDQSEDEENDEEEAEDSTLPADDILLTTTEYSAEGFFFEGKLWTVQSRLSIFQSGDFSSCLNVNAEVWLEAPHQLDIKAGYFQGVIIDKSVTSKKGQAAWIKELLQPKRCSRKTLMRHAGQENVVSELERYCQMYYEKDGSIRADKELDPVHQSMPATRKFLAIKDFFLEKRFRGKGLSTWAMLTYLGSIAHAPEHYAFEGYVFLSPGAFWHVYQEDVACRKANGLPPRSRLDVEAALRAAYGRMGYRLLIQGDPDMNRNGLTIMDRTFTKKHLHAELKTLRLASAQRMQTVTTHAESELAATASKKRSIELEGGDDIQTAPKQQKSQRIRKTSPNMMPNRPKPPTAAAFQRVRNTDHTAITGDVLNTTLVGNAHFDIIVKNRSSLVLENARNTLVGRMAEGEQSKNGGAAASNAKAAEQTESSSKPNTKSEDDDFVEVDRTGFDKANRRRTEHAQLRKPRDRPDSGDEIDEHDFDEQQRKRVSRWVEH